jgi:hypothetical protein
MKRLVLILPLAACVPHVDPCRPLPPCNPIVEFCHCVETDRADRPLALGDVPGHSDDDNGHDSGSSDDNGDVSDD